MTVFLYAILPALLAIAYGVVLIGWINKQGGGDDRMKAIAKAIQEGDSAYLGRQYKTIAYVALVVFFVLWIVMDWLTALGFVAGAVLSGLTGFIGMNISVRANIKTAEAAKTGIVQALNVAVRGGSITGLLVVGLGLLG